MVLSSSVEAHWRSVDTAEAQVQRAKTDSNSAENIEVNAKHSPQIRLEGFRSLPFGH